MDAAKRAALQITDAELAKWQDIVDRMYFPYDEKLGIFVQQDGFLDKDVKPVSSIPAGTANQSAWSWDHVLRSPYIKQADGCMNLLNWINYGGTEET